MYKKRNGFKSRQPPKRDKNKYKSSSQPLTCFECKMSSHKKTECPLLKKKSQKRSTKRKAMVATWMMNIYHSMMSKMMMNKKCQITILGQKIKAKR